MKIQSKCPVCGELKSANWKTSPILLRCKQDHAWSPRQDVLAVVYIYKTMTLEESLAL